MSNVHPSCPRVVGLTGLARSGKDTFAKVLVEAGYVRLSFADALKRKCATFLCISMEELEEQKALIRPFLQWYGTNWMRARDPNHWVSTVSDHVMRLLQEGRSVVITDVRFPNEADMVRSYDGTLIRMVRTDMPEMGKVLNHESEQHSMVMAVDAECVHSTVEGVVAAARRFLSAGGLDGEEAGKGEEAEDCREARG